MTYTQDDLDEMLSTQEADLRREIVDEIRRLGEDHELHALLHGGDPERMEWREIVKAIEHA